MVGSKRLLILFAVGFAMAEQPLSNDLITQLAHISQKEPDMLLKPSRKKVMCDMETGDNCGIEQLDPDRPSLIYPGGQTGCLEGGKYAFRIYPGATDKVYLHFQGGGACWDVTTSVVQRACKDGISEHPAEGIFDKSDARNPFKDYTIAMAVYCSGDLHVGNKVQDYGLVGSDGQWHSITQKGYWNAKATVDWVKANMAPTLESLVIGGCSAGSLGTQAWASEVLSTFKYKHAAVLLDSYLPMFPSSVDSRLMKDLGVCDSPMMLKYGLGRMCKDKHINFKSMLEFSMTTHPNVLFAVLNSKADGTQRYFGDVLGLTLGVLPDSSEQESYFYNANVILEELNKYPNFVSFLVSGNMPDQHCFVTFPHVYTATINGTSKGAKAGKDRRTIAQWITDVSKGNGAKSGCVGKRLRKAEWQGLDYCDEDQTPKVFPGKTSQRDVSAKEGIAESKEESKVVEMKSASQDKGKTVKVATPTPKTEESNPQEPAEKVKVDPAKLQKPTNQAPDQSTPQTATNSEVPLQSPTDTKVVKEDAEAPEDAMIPSSPKVPKISAPEPKQEGKDIALAVKNGSEIKTPTAPALGVQTGSGSVAPIVPVGNGKPVPPIVGAASGSNVKTPIVGTEVKSSTVPTSDANTVQNKPVQSVVGKQIVSSGVPQAVESKAVEREDTLDVAQMVAGSTGNPLPQQSSDSASPQATSAPKKIQKIDVQPVVPAAEPQVQPVPPKVQDIAKASKENVADVPAKIKLIKEIAKTQKTAEPIATADAKKREDEEVNAVPQKPNIVGAKKEIERLDPVKSQKTAETAPAKSSKGAAKKASDVKEPSDALESSDVEEDSADEKKKEDEKHRSDKVIVMEEKFLNTRLATPIGGESFGFWVNAGLASVAIFAAGVALLSTGRRQRRAAMLERAPLILDESAE